MKKFIAAALALVSVLGVIGGCSAKSDAKKTFTVGFDSEFPHRCKDVHVRAILLVISRLLLFNRGKQGLIGDRGQ